jgi:hypothetical protein
MKKAAQDETSAYFPEYTRLRRVRYEYDVCIIWNTESVAYSSLGFPVKSFCRSTY